MWRQILFSCACVLLYVYIKIIDSKPNKIKYQSKFFLYYLYSLIVTTLLCPYFLIKGRNIQNAAIITKFLKPMASFYDMKWRVDNLEHLTGDGCAVIISNHQMSLDLLGMFYVWHKIKNLAAIAKKEMMYLGVVGLMTYLAGTIFIDRKNPKQSNKVLNDTIDTIKKEKAKIWVFPEGTRNKAKKVKLLPFKKGAFVIAVGAQVPIIPVVFSSYYFMDEEKHVFYNGGKVIMKCLPPIPTTGLTMDDVPALQESFHKIILNTLEELNKEVLNELPSDYPLSFK